MKLKYYILLLICLLLSACSHQPETMLDSHFYTLSPQLPLPNVKPKKVVSLNIADLPDYLKQEPLVMRLSNQRLAVANYHFWAESPGAAISKAMQQYAMIHHQILLAQECDHCLAIKIHIAEFCADLQGTVVLSGFYQHNGMVHPFGFTEKMDNSGYGESVKVMQLLIERLTLQVTDNIQLK